MTEFIPHPYQEQIITAIVTHDRLMVAAGMGLGKTVSTLTALSEILAFYDHGPVLVLAPLRVARSTWPQEVTKWDHLKHLRVSVMCGSAAERNKAFNAEADIYVTNYESLPWLVEKCGDDWRFPLVVADESTRLKGFRTRQGTKRAGALGRVVHNTKRFIELTGTPAPQGLEDLWGQAYFLDFGERLGKSMTAFHYRWFKPVRVSSDAFAVQWVPTSSAQAEIQQRMRDICISLNAADWFDIDEPIERTVEVELPPKAREVYRSMEQELCVELASGEITAANAAVRSGKCLQIASGALYTDDAGSYEVLHDAKIEALRSVIEEAAGMPVLVAYQFKSDLERLLKAFPRGRALDKSPRTIADWNAGRIPVLFAHPASAGHGLNLQDGGNILAVFSHDWNLETYLQMVERIGPTRQAQAGHKRPVFIYQIVAKDTMDEVVIERRKTKRATQDLLLEYLKRKTK